MIHGERHRLDLRPHLAVGGAGNRLVEIHARNWNAAVGSGFLGGALKAATQNGLVADLRRLCAASVAVSFARQRALARHLACNSPSPQLPQSHER